MPWPDYDKKDDIPKGMEDMYEEKDGKWIAKPADLPEGTPTAEDLTKLKSALDKERDERKSAEKKTKEIEVARKKLEEEAAGQKVGLTEERIEEFKASLRADLTEEYKGQVEDLTAKIEKLEGVGSENRMLKLDHAVKGVMLSKAVGVRGDRVDDLFRLASDEFDLTDDGKPKLTKHPGKTLEVFLADDLKKRYPEFYKGTQGSGGGAGGSFNSDGSPVVGTTAEDVLKNPKEAIAAARAAGETS